MQAAKEGEIILVPQGPASGFVLLVYFWFAFTHRVYIYNGPISKASTIAQGFSFMVH